MAPVKRSREEWHQHVIAALAQQRARGEPSVPVKKLKMLCKYPGTEPSFKNNILSKLKMQKDAIEYPQIGHAALTDTGVALAGNLNIGATTLSTNKEVQDHIKETLINRKSQVEAFDFLAQDGQAHTYAEIARACSGKYDPNSPSFSNNIMSKLRSAGVVENVDTSNKLKAERTVRLTDMCYPHGRP
jgi:hypothetical protein